jgi:hypothetical protein
LFFLNEHAIRQVVPKSKFETTFFYDTELASLSAFIQKRGGMEVSRKFSMFKELLFQKPE